LEFNVPFQHKYGYIRDEMSASAKQGGHKRKESNRSET